MDSIKYSLSENEGGILLSLAGRIYTDNAGLFLKEIKKRFKDSRPNSITVDLSGLKYLDDYGIMVFSEIREMLAQRDAFKIINADERISNFLSIMAFDSAEREEGRKKKGINLFENLGGETIRFMDDFRFMLSFLGAVFLALYHACLRPKTIRIGDTIHFMQRAGVEALLIVALINFLLGLIIAFMSSIQLRQFGR